MCVFAQSQQNKSIALILSDVSVKKIAPFTNLSTLLPGLLRSGMR